MARSLTVSNAGSSAPYSVRRTATKLWRQGLLARQVTTYRSQVQRPKLDRFGRRAWEGTRYTNPVMETVHKRAGKSTSV